MVPYLRSINAAPKAYAHWLEHAQLRGDIKEVLSIAQKEQTIWIFIPVFNIAFFQRGGSRLGIDLESRVGEGFVTTFAHNVYRSSADMDLRSSW